MYTLLLTNILSDVVKVDLIIRRKKIIYTVITHIQSQMLVFILAAIFIYVVPSIPVCFMVQYSKSHAYRPIHIFQYSQFTRYSIIARLYSFRFVHFSVLCMRPSQFLQQQNVVHIFYSFDLRSERIITIVMKRYHCIIISQWMAGLADNKEHRNP